MTETTQRDVRTSGVPKAVPRRRDPLSMFLWLGSAVLVLGLIGFGVLYVRDQYVPKAPSIAEQGIAQAEAAVRESPNNVPARLTLGTLYSESKRYDEAVAQFDEVLKVDPGNQDAMMGKGYALLTKGDLDGAAAEYTKVVTQNRSGEFAGADTRLQGAYYFLGSIAVAQGQPTKAMQYLNQALVISPTDSDALYQVGLANAQMGKHKQAVAALTKALTFVPTGWCEPYPAMASSYTAMNKPEQAAYASAMGQFCGGQVETAKATLSGLAEGPAAVDAMLGLGLIAQTQNDEKAAIEWYRKVLKTDPKNETAQSYLTALGAKPKK